MTKGECRVDFQIDMIEDKVEFFEASDLKTLEKKINEQIEVNKAILLSVHSVSHQMQFDENGRPYYSAVVHFKAKK
ncbi:YrzA family protein [Bacillus methanolicus]|uniref:YrzA family protein n=1 Tax=Bacillus methanolicus TaxID=1471 RepID=UPI003994C553